MLTFFVALTLSAIRIVTGSFADDNFPAEILKDSLLTFPQLVSKYGYPVESHYVHTKDEYILQMFRIPRNGARPVFLMHGLLDSSTSWVLMGPWSGFAYYLYDLGYDVWLGNARGSRYSRNHTSLDPDKDWKYWYFSWHEIGIYDLPAMIDYVLQQTHHTKLNYVGHSQGCTSFFVMASMRPEYNAKISTMHAMAPAVFCNNVRAPLRDLGLKLTDMSKDLVMEALPYNKMAYNACLASRHSFDMCVEGYHQFFGPDPGSVNKTMWPMVFGQETNGCSMRQFQHYMQLVRSGRFAQYDYGAKENNRRYGRSTPPDYPLAKVTARVAFNYAYNDYLSNELDVQRLIRLLPNVVDDQLIPQRSWNHMTVVWGVDARKVVQKRIVEVMQKFED